MTWQKTLRCFFGSVFRDVITKSSNFYARFPQRFINFHLLTELARTSQNHPRLILEVKKKSRFPFSYSIGDHKLKISDDANAMNLFPSLKARIAQKNLCKNEAENGLSTKETCELLAASFVTCNEMRCLSQLV